VNFCLSQARRIFSSESSSCASPEALAEVSCMASLKSMMPPLSRKDSEKGISG